MAGAGADHPASAEPRPRPGPGAASWWWDWKRMTVAIGLLLALVGQLNTSLHARASDESLASSTATALRSLLQEESNLQWRVLAERGPALEVARRMGELRSEEYELRDALIEHALHDPAKLLEHMQAYHAAIDRELGLLAVGRLAEALDYEITETIPLFERLDSVLIDIADHAEDHAAASRSQATSTLVVALLVILALIGLLMRRTQVTHADAAGAIAVILDKERAATVSLERTKAMVHHQATHDPLTDLPNRLGLREGLREIVDRADALLCVLFIDLDGFKAVNDRYGHERGDRVLCSVADALRARLRATELAARVGGDEFVVVSEVPDVAAGHTVATRLRGMITSMCASQGVGDGLGASIGAAIGPAGEVRRLLDEADRDMYRQKRDRYAAGGGPSMTTGVPTAATRGGGRDPRNTAVETRPASPRSHR